VPIQAGRLGLFCILKHRLPAVTNFNFISGSPEKKSCQKLAYSGKICTYAGTFDLKLRSFVKFF